MYQFSKKSLERLATCHEDLQVLASEVLKIHDCTVVCGYRNKEEQNRFFAEGVSKLRYPNGKHNQIPSRAIDLGPYVRNQSLYDREQVLLFAGIVIGVAHMLYQDGRMKHKIRWGGDWDSDNNFKEHSFFDGIHFELVS